jgi:hypothetical protein
VIVPILEQGPQRALPPAIERTGARSGEESRPHPGVIFVEENGGGPGVRLKKRRPRRGSIPDDELNAENDE